MRKRYVQINGELIEVTPEYKQTPKSTGIQIIPDIQPYMTAAVDKELGKRIPINSRREHREFLRRNGYVEFPDFKPTRPEE